MANMMWPGLGSRPQTRSETSAPLRLHSRQQLQQALAEIRAVMPATDRLALLLLNLDKFRFVNDLCGPAGGDMLLDIVKQDRLDKLPDARTLHLAADEFICLLPFDKNDDLIAFVSEVQRTIGEPIWIGHHVVHLTATIGLVIDEGEARSADDLLQAASIALTQAHETGGNTVLRFRPEMFLGLNERAELQDDFRLSLLRGEILPHYQPIVALESALPKGFEALARWHHPRQGLVSPDRFLPIAQDLGLDRDLLLLMLRQACRDARDWPPHFTISVNMAPTQLCDTDIAMNILKILFASGLAPGRLIIEITENALIENVASAENTIQSLRQAGVRIALDDFGTGYANLKRLCSLKIDQMKIDRTLIQAIDTAFGRKLVKAVVDLGNSLSMPVIAEGIETQEQARFMQEVNCAFGQGYLFGRPAPADVARTLAFRTMA